MKNCVYCNNYKDITKEHLISLGVLKEFFTNKMNNMVAIRKNGEFKDLNKFEGIVKDVCKKCNSKISELGYDNAGIDLAKLLISQHENTTFEFIFDIPTLGWIIKTHLNLIREYNYHEKWNINLNPKLFECIINGQLVESNLFVLLLSAIDLKPSIWTEFKRPSRIETNLNFIDGKNLFYSYLRLMYLNTYLILPKDGNYNLFESEKENAIFSIFLLFDNHAKVINISSKIIDNKLELIKDFTENEFKAGLINLKDYKRKFEKTNL